MNAIEAIIPALLLVLAFRWLVARELDKLEDPAYLRRHGVVIQTLSALEDHSAPIGRYRDREVWGSVTFMGMRYRFDRVAPASGPERLGERELYLPPGLVYVTD